MKKLFIVLLIILLFSVNVNAGKVNEIENLINDWNPQVKNSKLIAKTIYFESKVYNVDRRAILAIAIQESDFRQNVIGKNEEIGIMQVKLSTGKDMENKDELLDLYKIQDNIIAGIRYFRLCRDMMSEYAEDYYELLLLTFTAYNQGPWGVKAELEKGNNPINGYAERAMELRYLILTGQLN